MSSSSAILINNIRICRRTLTPFRLSPVYRAAAATAVMSTTSTSSAAILSLMKHVTANKWDKAADRLDEINSHVRDAEAALSYKPDAADSSHDLEADVTVLLNTVRKAFAGSLRARVRARGRRSQRGGRGGRGGGISSSDTNLEERLDTIESQLCEAKYSSGLSNSAMLAWRDELLGYLHKGQRRMTYTILFGRLTDEWTEFRFGELSDSKEAAKGRNRRADSEMSEDESTVAVGRKEMYEQRQIWEAHVTNQRTTDTDKIVEFLDDLFHSGPRHEAARSSDEPTDLRAILLRAIRKTISSLCREKPQMNAKAVKAAITAVLSSDQLTSEKRRATLDLSNKENVLTEIADILNIDLHLSSINRWSWGDRPITAQMRKAINGKYRVYLDLELLDSILIQCVGQFISCNINTALKKAWASDLRDVWQPKEDEHRTAALQAQIKDFTSRKSNYSIHMIRQSIYERIFFSPRLPSDMYDEFTASGAYDEDRSNAGEDEANLTDLIRGEPRAFALKTDILRLCSAEMAVQKLVQGQFCILQSDFEWFGPSLPHSTLVTIMKYFHFPSELVHFFEAFISMRMQFEDDGNDGPVMTRKTGIPTSFQITDAITELLLFVLDFAVNQRTGGAHLYRNHDDLWFWGKPEQCVIAWETICEFTEVMGLQLNKDKTASVHAVDPSNPRYTAADKAHISRLPGGQVKWGFLLFDPTEWKWTANKPAIEAHMDELRFQLKSRTSVMAYIQAYNAYMKNLLPNNFGQVVIGLGDDHPTMVLEALQYAQRHLYRSGDGDESSASVAQYVKALIQKRFGGTEQYEVPDCFLYLDVKSGGLGLANPVPAFAQYIPLSKKDEDEGDEDNEDKLRPMERALYRMNKELSECYRADSKNFAERLHKKRQHLSWTDKGRGVSEFMSFSDYLRTAQEHSEVMTTMYKALLNPPPFDASRPRPNPNHWAASMFDSELDELFGGSIIEQEFLSLGLYRTLAEEKVRWTG